MAKIGHLIRACLAIAIFYLGFTIYHFTSTVERVIEMYPNILVDVQKTSEQLNINGWLDVANKYSELAPQAMQMTEDVNKTIADVNQTIASFDTKLPEILSEVHGVRTETIPAVISESASLREVLPPMLNQVDAIVDKSEEITSHATQGAVKGVILSPIQLLKDAGSGIKSTVIEEDEE